MEQSNIYMRPGIQKIKHQSGYAWAVDLKLLEKMRMMGR